MKFFVVNYLNKIRYHSMASRTFNHVNNFISHCFSSTLLYPQHTYNIYAVKSFIYSTHHTIHAMKQNKKEEKPEKYRVVIGRGRNEFEGKINALAENYYLKNVLGIEDEASYHTFAGVMSRREKTESKSVEKFVDAPNDEVQDYLDKGYEIEQIYSKHTVLTKTREEKPKETNEETEDEDEGEEEIAFTGVEIDGELVR